ncbi:MAG: cell wall hydrolase [Alphaproteobacteria bacterium]|nr:cell wall hydrolase [Alphaproteobacteria bacterium]MBV9371806.1 cell wall hydrolase [Alphaproteobacteria bacterium]MBV9901909.1 cell wall hydrolase [Alphaproteobacteria bacterium]
MLGSLRPRLFAAFVLAAFAFVSTPALAADGEGAPVVQTASIATLPNLAAIVRDQTAQAERSAAPAPTAAIATATPRPLRDMVVSFVDYGNYDAEQLCLAKAVYFEARSESLEGQLAVAEVVLNRAASGRYPPTVCAVVTQHAQFSFIRAGRFPTPDTSSEGWHKALAIADIAAKRLASQVGRDVLWYHATYVAPAWGRQRTRAAQIGTHIFYS